MEVGHDSSQVAVVLKALGHVVALEHPLPLGGAVVVVERNNSPLLLVVVVEHVELVEPKPFDIVLVS